MRIPAEAVKVTSHDVALEREQAVEVREARSPSYPLPRVRVMTGALSGLGSVALQTLRRLRGDPGAIAGCFMDRAGTLRTADHRRSGIIAVFLCDQSAI